MHKNENEMKKKKKKEKMGNVCVLVCWFYIVWFLLCFCSIVLHDYKKKSCPYKCVCTCTIFVRQWCFFFPKAYMSIIYPVYKLTLSVQMSVLQSEGLGCN